MLRLILLVCMGVLVSGSVAASPSFTGLGGGYESTALKVSPDGSTVVGYFDRGSGVEPFRWTATTGMQHLGTILGAASGGMAFDTSWDGSVIVGYTEGIVGQEAFRWTAETGMLPMGTIHTSGSHTVARGVTADGAFAVGIDCAAPTLRPCEAFTWSPATGTAGQGQLRPTGTYSQFNAVSADGRVAVGFGDAALGQEVFRWTQSEGLVGLGFFGGAHDISADGSTIVGHDFDGYAAFVWSETNGVVHIPAIPGASRSGAAYGVSADGSIVVGNFGFEDGAFVWSAGTGTQKLSDVLIQHGLASALDGWVLQVAIAISDDGQTITGYGVNPSGVREAFIATIPEPSTALLVGLGLTLIAANRSRRTL